MIILNIEGFYDRMIEHLKFTTEQGFMKQQDLDRLIVCNTIEEAIERLQTIVIIDEPVDIDKMVGHQ